MSPEVMVRLHDAWHEVATNDSIRVAILTGTGDQAFCAGADLALTAPLMTGGRQPDNEWDERFLQLMAAPEGMYLFKRDIGKPVIAAINGHAIAGGLELVMGTDIRFAVPQAKFGLQEVKWGLFPAGASTVRLPGQVPYAKALELLLTGDLMSAEEARLAGLVNHVVEPGELMPAALAMAGRIAGNGPLAVRQIRRSVRACYNLPEAEALVVEARLAEPVTHSQDAVEGPRAFMEKRKPVFHGR
jgi:enoyl-CoA hydratase